LTAMGRKALRPCKTIHDFILIGSYTKMKCSRFLGCVLQQA
jgi:hypothetical protein